MRLGTKILLLTLAITLCLAGIIVWVVTRDLTAHETERAQADIGRAVSDYFERIESHHTRTVYPITRTLVEDPQNRAQLEVSTTATTPRGNISSCCSLRSSRRKSRGKRPADVATAATTTSTANPTTAPAKAHVPDPVFHVVLNFEGKSLLTFAPNDPALEAALSTEKIDWPTDKLLADVPELTRRYIWVNGKLYLALGIPLRIEVSEAPTHAYFLGYPIDNAWATYWLGERNRSDENAVLSKTGHHEQTPLHSWFVVGGNIVARGATSSLGAIGEHDIAESAERALKAIAVSSTVNMREPVAFQAEGEQYIGEAVAFDLPGGRRGSLAVTSSLTQALARLRHIQATIAWVTVGVMIVAVIAFRYVSNLIARPVSLLVEGSRRIAKGEFEKPIAVTRQDELGELAISFNEMAAGLQQRDLVKSTFGKFVDPKVVEGFLANPDLLMPGGEKRVQTMMFSDLANFTSLSEKLPPDKLVALLNGHLGDAADIVTDTRGIVDKFIGDAVVAFWGPPITSESGHAGLACRAALRITQSVRRPRRRMRPSGHAPLCVRVGVATGEVLVGIIGSANKYNYTVMGDTTNLGSRLEGLNKIYGTSVLVTARTAHEASSAVFHERESTRVRVIGREEPVELHEVLGEKEDTSHNGAIPLRCEAYAEAFRRYERRAWLEAHGAFQKICTEWPHDAVARAMADRCAEFQQADPAPTGTACGTRRRSDANAFQLRSGDRKSPCGVSPGFKTTRHHSNPK